MSARRLLVLGYPRCVFALLPESIGTTTIVAHAGRHDGVPQVLGALDYASDIGYLPGVEVDARLANLLARIRHS